ncbi:hypothetical protein ACJJTC_010556 [Scirpophaga incertulas]
MTLPWTVIVAAAILRERLIVTELVLGYALTVVVVPAEGDLSNIIARKRKHDYDITESFKTFTEDILTRMDSLKIDVNNSSLQINKTLNSVIKEDLSKLKECTTELRTEVISIRKEYSELKSSITKLDKQHTEMKNNISELQQSSQLLSDLYEDQKKKTDILSKEVKQVDEFEVTLNALKEQNRKMASLINSNEQRDRQLNVEVVGIPEDKNEDLMRYIADICKYIGVNIIPGDVKHVNRVSPKVKSQGRLRVIIAKLSTRLLKDNIISLGRKKRVTTKDIGLSGDPKPIYINEHLTPYNKQLLKKCKEIAMKKEYKYVWTKNGRIYIRKNDTSPAIQIHEEEDLRKKTGLVNQLGVQ